MAEQLMDFLMAMAKDEESFARFVKNPRAEAVKAGLPAEDVAALLERDPRKIFARLRSRAQGGDCVWVFKPLRPVRRQPKAQPKTRKMAPRRHR